MIRQTVIDAAMNRLMARFGKRLILQPPATMSDLAQLEERVGPLPRDLVIFLATCNGLKLKLSRRNAETNFCCTHTILQQLETQRAAPPGLVPLRQNADGRWDWLVLEEGALHGAVLRYETGTPGVELVATSFGQYFDGWTKYLADWFTDKGAPRARRVPVFDQRVTARIDKELRPLMRSSKVRSELREMELQIAGGADYD
ncbi:MAG: SMI1/KNR4 family protein [Phycisphaerae bacterium]